MTQPIMKQMKLLNKLKQTPSTSWPMRNQRKGTVTIFKKGNFTMNYNKTLDITSATKKEMTLKYSVVQQAVT